ncbi:hypothetical protein PBRA_009454 [Plasmodiophora brassicae]|uniref:CCHC-type domain-containing protein n=1 Tax=Plasmodiophora brassicae TaxID=37360 RepID=A0A0G4J870_PLABS|nr:hypothetical protein PBRA_009454 [Plasmodiophora brassicae]
MSSDTIAAIVAEALQAQRVDIDAMLRQQRAEILAQIAASPSIVPKTETIDPDRPPTPLSTISYSTPVRLHTFTGDDSEPVLASSLDGVALKLYVAIKPSSPQALKTMLLENFPEITAARAKAEFDALRQTGPFAGHLVEFRRRYFVAVARDPDCRLSDSSLAEKLRTSLTPALAEELYKWQLRSFSAMVDNAVHLAPLFPVPSAAILNVATSELQPLTDEERDRCRREGRCFRCREPGHMANQCPRSQPGNVRG